MNNRQKQIPGVLGGMGPEATVDFLAKLIAQTAASCDQEHIRALVDHNPGVPNRHTAIAGNGQEVATALATMARGLENNGADFLVLVCNTAHAFAQDIQRAVQIPFVSIIDEVIDELQTCWSHFKQVGVMAADGCLASQLYQQALMHSGREAVIWSTEEQDSFMSLLYQIKGGVPIAEVKVPLAQLADSLHQRGAEVLIAGCTEIPLVLNASDTSVPLVASTDVLVSRTIDYALGNRNLPGEYTTQQCETLPN